MKLSSLVWFVGFTIFPLFWWPWADVIYEIPKVSIFYVWVWILTASYLFGHTTKLVKVNTKGLCLVLGFLLIAIVSSIFGENFSKSIVGNYYRSDGLVTLVHLITLAYLVSYYASKKDKEYAVWGVTIGVFLTSSWAIISSIFNFEPTGVHVSFGNPNFLAGYLAVTLPVTLFLYRKHYLWVLLICVHSLALLLTFSVGGILAGVAAISLWLIIYLNKRYIIFFLILAIIAGALYGLRNWGSSVLIAEGRERIVRKVFTGAMQRPVLGWGWANVDYAFTSNDWPIPILHDVYVDKAHSTLLEVLTTTGSVGLVIYIALIAFALINIANSELDKKEKALWLTVLVTYIIHSQTNVISISEEVYFWICIGISLRRT